MAALKGIAEQFTAEHDKRGLLLSGRSDTLDFVHPGYSIS
jgi:hypothetical protein